MSWTMKVITAALATIALVSLSASAAEAVTWHNSGSTAFTATGGAWALSIGGNHIACQALSGVGTATTGPFVGNGWAAVTGTFTGAPCLVGGTNYALECAYKFTAVTTSGSTTLGATDLTCYWGLTAGPRLCHIGGTLATSYTNPSGSATGRFTFPTSNSLTVTNLTSCIWGTGTAEVEHFGLTVTQGTGGSGTGGPVIIRTP